MILNGEDSLGQSCSASRQEQVDGWFPEGGKTEALMYPPLWLRALRPLQSHDLGLGQCPVPQHVVWFLLYHHFSFLICAPGLWSTSRWRMSMSLLPPSKSQPIRPSSQRARSMTASCRSKPLMRTAPPSTARFATMKLSQQMCLLPLTETVSVLGKIPVQSGKQIHCPRSQGQERPHMYLAVVPPLEPFI